MWVGTFSHGINFMSIDVGKFTHYKSIPPYSSLSNNNVLSICEDSKNNLWIATDGEALIYSIARMKNLHTTYMRKEIKTALAAIMY